LGGRAKKKKVSRRRDRTRKEVGREGEDLPKKKKMTKKGRVKGGGKNLVKAGRPCGERTNQSGGVERGKGERYKRVSSNSKAMIKTEGGNGRGKSVKGQWIHAAVGRTHGRARSSSKGTEKVETNRIQKTKKRVKEGKKKQGRYSWVANVEGRSVTGGRGTR